MGDPAGVGPEIIVKAHLEPELHDLCVPFVYGDVGILQRAADLLRAPLRVSVEGEVGPGVLRVVPVSSLDVDETPFGKPTIDGDKAMTSYIKAATLDALAGSVDALVTAPVTKEGLRRAGVKHPGHTELLADICGGHDVVMMLAGERLKVALVTIHASVRAALDSLTPALVEQTLRITDAFLRRNVVHGRPPRIAVCGVNPHAGEHGMFGDEESVIVIPAIAACRADGIDATGPYPADTIFHRAYHGGEFDVVVAIFHDQGLGPFKLVHFDEGVNVTMGLPIVRTSVDHGTAHDIAGLGTASASSLLAAVRSAASFVSVRASN